MREFAPAKVNLYLHVTGRRHDGYHLLDSLVAFPAVGDIVALEASCDSGQKPRRSDMTLRVSGPFGSAIEGDENLVLRAARALAGHMGKVGGASLTLEKNLPVASGIGGGSSDAAAALRLLTRLWKTVIPPGLPLTLGADVPVCLDARPRRMAGVGEQLSDVPDLPASGIVLANPGVAVATPAIFRARTGGFSVAAAYPARWSNAEDLAAWLSPLRNDLEAPAIALCPVIADVLAALRRLPGCLLARMSGSGATCYALFGTSDAAERAAGHVARHGWWVWGGSLAGRPRERGIAEPG